MASQKRITQHIVGCGLFCGALLLIVVAGRSGEMDFLTLPARHVAASVDLKANATQRQPLPWHPAKGRHPAKAGKSG
jgi:hypothetical protein